MDGSGKRSGHYRRVRPVLRPVLRLVLRLVLHLVLLVLRPVRLRMVLAGCFEPAWHWPCWGSLRGCWARRPSAKPTPGP